MLVLLKSMASYHDQLQALAESIGSDGCTHGLEICIECCWEHDWTYVTGMTPRGVVVSKEYADKRFRDCIQAHTSLRWLNPLSWWRYVAVVKFGHGIWGKPLAVVPHLYRNEILIKMRLTEARNSRVRILEQILVT